VLSAFSSPESHLPEQPVVASASRQRPGAALDHFFMRRRSSTIGEQFWNFVAREWPGFNPIERTRSARLFSRYRPYWSPDRLSREDRAFYDSLPEHFTAYRGQNGVELAAGGSFTLSETVARHYAAGRRKISYTDPTVLALHVVKADVALAFAARDEMEIVLFPSSSNVRPEAMRSAHLTH
jgi:hypothetical protein